jgi:hypothetical protein
MKRVCLGGLFDQVPRLVERELRYTQDESHAIVAATKLAMLLFSGFGVLKKVNLHHPEADCTNATRGTEL